MTPPPSEARSRDPELVRLGERLKQTRDYLGVSQQYVSEGTGIPRTAISDIERGERRVDSLELKKLARLYRRPVSYYLSEEKDADVGEHVLAGLPRALAQLTDGDQKTVLEFAEYLSLRRAAEREAPEETVDAGGTRAVNWNLAHRIAGIAANQAHRDLGVDRTGYVPVHRSLRAARVIGMAQPMPRLFGVYRSVRDDGPAILLNAGLDIITQRHTAAHELGHHRLGHHSVYDKEIDPGLRWGNGSWPDDEKTAEAFAAWYLMPRPAVLAALQHVAQGPPRGPEDAYLVARALGTSYAGTVPHLVRLSQLEAGRAEQWLRIAPAAIKSSLLQGRAVAAGAHVHVLGAALHGRQVHADVGDILVPHPDLAQPFFDALPKGIERWSDGTHGGGQLEIVTLTDEFTHPSPVRLEVPGHAEPLQVSVMRESPRTGIDDAWPP